MAVSDHQDWDAAIAAWNELGEAQQNVAIGYIAGRDPGLVAEAAAAAADDDAGAAGGSREA